MNLSLYLITFLLLLISFYKDRKKTKLALKKAWKAFANILPEFLVVITLVGILIAAINP
jgi:predicted membrane protein